MEYVITAEFLYKINSNEEVTKVNFKVARVKQIKPLTNYELIKSLLIAMAKDMCAEKKKI